MSSNTHKVADAFTDAVSDVTSILVAFVGAVVLIAILRLVLGRSREPERTAEITRLEGGG